MNTTTAQASLFTTYGSTAVSTLTGHGRFSKRCSGLLAKVLPAAELDRLALEQKLDPLALDTPADLGEIERVGRRRQQLVVLAEAEIGHGGLVSEWNPLDVDHEPAAGGARHKGRISGKTVGEADQRVGLRGQ